MIVLDTNVLSELMKAAPAGAVMAWMARTPASVLYTTSITQAEILHGILLLPQGRKRRAFQDAADTTFADNFDGRILAFGSAAALSYASIAVAFQRAGRPISQLDAQIAAIAHSMAAAVATRNVTDFDGCGVKVVNPWDG